MGLPKMWKLIKFGISCLIVLSLFTNLCSSDDRLKKRHWRYKRFVEMGPDIAGPYCATRAGEKCCPGRNDECTVPILGTLCYCDKFCNHTSFDCCPDYQDVCGNSRPPGPVRRACNRDGVEYPPDAKITDNCNECKCTRGPLPGGQYIWNCTTNVCLIQPKVMRVVNDGDYGWKAANYSVFWGKTLDDGIRQRLGTMPPDTDVRSMGAVQITIPKDIPESFDARVKWENYIHPVRDQGDCGASWAFSTVAVAGDRLAIESDGILSDELSPQHLLSCNIDRGQLGCEGGYLDRAWSFLRKTGVVSETCYPYHSGQTGVSDKCMMLKKGKNSLICPNSNSSTPGSILHSTPPYRVSNDEAEIMMEVMTNGPVQATFKVKEDFFMYKSGIYHYSNATEDSMPDDLQRGYHSVKIVGWGVEKNKNGEETKYWICVNSWGERWGEKGSFRILRGNNERFIEQYIFGMHGDIKKVLAKHPRQDIRDLGLYNLYNKKQRKPGKGKVVVQG